MQMITSDAGTRLAKAKVALDRAEEAMECAAAVPPRDYSLIHHDFMQAARDLAAELVASGCHDLDGGEA